MQRGNHEDPDHRRRHFLYPDAVAGGGLFRPSQAGEMFELHEYQRDHEVDMPMKRPDRTDHLVSLHKETIDAMGVTCSECGRPGDKLLVFYTLRGGNRRTHNGSFCSKHCHDVFHGLKPRLAK
jgi:hypothetical protein